MIGAEVGTYRGMATYTVNKKAVARVCGDLRRVHRSALIACVFRAAEWKHKEVELAAHKLLQHLDETASVGARS
jgi:hypothetical protein